MTPVMEALSGLASYASAGISSVKSVMISCATCCYNTAISTLSSVKEAGKKAYTFTASTYEANKPVADVALAVLGISAAGIAAYTGRVQIAAAATDFVKLFSK